MADTSCLTNLSDNKTNSNSIKYFCNRLKRTFVYMQCFTENAHCVCRKKTGAVMGTAVRNEVSCDFL